MKQLRLLAILLIAAIASATIAAADRAFDFYASNMVLLQDRRIQTAVGITDAQRKKMNAFADADRPKRTAIVQQFQREAIAAQKAGKPYQPDSSKIRPLDVALKQNVLGILSDSQLKRLRELTIQSGGLVALMDERVAKEAGVSSAQVTKLRTIFTTGAKNANDIRQVAEKRIFDEYSKKKPKTEAEGKKLQQEALAKLEKEVGPTITRIQRETKSKMEALLSPAQKDGLKKLEGVPFKG